MLCVYGDYILFSFLQCGDRLYTSECDVYGRQILTSIDSPRAESVNLNTNNSDRVLTGSMMDQRLWRWINNKKHWLKSYLFVIHV